MNVLGGDWEDLSEADLKELRSDIDSNTKRYTLSINTETGETIYD